jgi:hypothetical protein
MPYSLNNIPVHLYLYLFVYNFILHTYRNEAARNVLSCNATFSIQAYVVDTLNVWQLIERNRPRDQPNTVFMRIINNSC